MQATRVSSTVHPLTRGLPVDDLGTLFDRYDLPGAYDEMFDALGRPRVPRSYNSLCFCPHALVPPDARSTFGRSDH